MFRAAKSREQRRLTLGRVLWSGRVEIAITGASLLAALVVLSSPWYVGAVTTVSVVALALWKPSRERSLLALSRALRHARVRRQVVHAGWDVKMGRLSVERVVPVLPGELVRVRVPRGQTVDKLRSSERAMAACLRVLDVRVAQGSDRSLADLSIIRRDPFEGKSAVPWPLLDVKQTSVRDPMPIGLDEFGHVVPARLLSRNLIVGGAPDSGKSAFLRLPAAYAALDPLARLWMMDGKQVEFEAWRTCAHEFVSGPDLQGAVELLSRLREEMEERYRRLTAMGEVFVQPDMNVDVLMIDEVPTYTRPTVTTDKADAGRIKTIQGLLWEIVARGRAAGVITILSAQKPDANTLPTEIRDLCDNKLALHCNTKAASDTILGQGAGDDSAPNAAEIRSGQPGVCFYVGDDGARRMKTFFISYKQALEVASRAAGRQLDCDLRQLSS